MSYVGIDGAVGFLKNFPLQRLHEAVQNFDLLGSAFCFPSEILQWVYQHTQVKFFSLEFGGKGGGGGVYMF